MSLDKPDFAPPDDGSAPSRLSLEGVAALMESSMMSPAFTRMGEVALPDLHIHDALASVTDGKVGAVLGQLTNLAPLKYGFAAVSHEQVKELKQHPIKEGLELLAGGLAGIQVMQKKSNPPAPKP